MHGAGTATVIEGIVTVELATWAPPRAVADGDKMASSCGAGVVAIAAVPWQLNAPAMNRTVTLGKLNGRSTSPTPARADALSDSLNASTLTATFEKVAVALAPDWNEVCAEFSVAPAGESERVDTAKSNVVEPTLGGYELSEALACTTWIPGDSETEALSVEPLADTDTGLPSIDMVIDDEFTPDKLSDQLTDTPPPPGVFEKAAGDVHATVGAVLSTP